jgi:hypothetical protein
MANLGKESKNSELKKLPEMSNLFTQKNFSTIFHVAFGYFFLSDEASCLFLFLSLLIDKK